MVKLAHLIPVLLLVTSTLGHICMIYPEQRGGAKINGPGSHACFQPTAPCGTATPQPPTVTLYGGTTFYVLVQQNLNHYNPGNPGFIDIGFSVGTNQTSDDQFVSLVSIPDYWPHVQGWQTNFTIPIRVPNIECEWCTLQVRYHPNKPTEPIFHNCADIAITTPAVPNVQGRLMGIAKPGPSYSAEDNLSSFAVIDVGSGNTQRLSPSSYHIGIRDAMPAHRSFQPIEFLSQELFVVANGLVAPLEQTDLYYFLSRPSGIAQRGPFTQLSEFNISTLNYTVIPLTFPNGIDQWAGIVSTHSKSTPAPFIIIGQTTSNNVYNFSPYWLFPNGTISGPIGTSMSDSTFVNYFWSEFNPCAGSQGVVYVLSGDENSLTTLDVTLYSFDVATGAVTAVLVNNTEFTVSSIHAWVGQDCNYLYTVSPGIVNTSPSNRVWSLINIDPATGSIVMNTPITPPGLYNSYYGGGVYGTVTPNNQLLYLFQRSIDTSFDLYGINLQTGLVDFQTGVNLGVNGAYFLSSVSFSPQ